MGLTTPELDLLREALVERPGDPAFLQVAGELIQRTRWTEAVEVLYQGVNADSGQEDAWPLLVDAAFYDAQYERALWAIEQLQPDPSVSPHLSRRAIECLERLGHLEAAREAVRAFLAIHPEDEGVSEIKQRLTSAGPAPRLAALDPFYDIERAEHYVAMGRPDRAFRVLRRVQFRNPGDDWLAARLRELRHGPVDPMEDDLSEEIAPLVEPPELLVPMPALGVPELEDFEELDELEDLEELEDAFVSELGEDDDFEDEDTQVGLPDDQEQETQPDRLPPGSRERLLATTGRAVAHAASDEPLEDEDTEEVEDEAGPIIDEALPQEIGGEIDEFLKKSGDRRRRRSLIKP